MKYDLKILETNKADVIDFVQKYHYSPVMPKLTKHFLGAYLDNKLVGVMTLGWGTQPLGTIRKLFPNLLTKDYFEIGKMCMDPEMPRNSESQFLSKMVEWIKKNYPDKYFLYTWADGIVGKVGYVYQGSNFYYGGFIWTDIYISDKGEKIHPRSSKELCKENAKMLGKEKVFWLTYDFIETKGIKRIRGKQFRYIFPLNKKAAKLLTKNWGRIYPKEKDLEWKQQTNAGYKVVPKPDLNMSVVEYNKKNVNQHKKKLNNMFFKW